MAGFPTLKGSWPWPWIGSCCIPSCITHRPLATCQILLKSKNLFVDGRTDTRTYTCTYRRTFKTGFIRSTLSKSQPKNKHVVQVVWPNATSTPRIVQLFATGKPFVYLVNGFSSKWFTHLYCPHVLFLGTCCHWLKRHTKWPKRLYSQLQRWCNFEKKQGGHWWQEEDEETRHQSRFEDMYHTYDIIGIICTYFNVWYFIIRIHIWEKKFVT